MTQVPSYAMDSDETAGGVEPSPVFPPSPNLGELGRLGPYRILMRLGHGGMGEVYLALDERLERKLALKVMLPKFAANPSAKARFLREARAAAQITHDNVVTVYEADERDGVPFIAMQFLQGYPLDEYLQKKGAPSFPQILAIGRETAAGLAAAHAIGLVHRDIKPGNLWLEAPNGRVKVLDFGLARPVDSQAELTRSGAVIGTPAYMSPEQARGQKVDGRTDLFSLGAVLYRLVTGRLPFGGSNVMAILTALATEEPTPVRELNPEVPVELADVIHRLLAKRAADRPQTADDVVDLIREIEREASIAGLQSAYPQAVYVPMQVTANPESAFADIAAEDSNEIAAPTTPKPARTKSLPWLLIGSAFAFLLCAAAAAVIKITNKDGTVTEIGVPDGSKIVVDGEPVTPVTKPPDPDLKVKPETPGTTRPAAFKNKFDMEFVRVPKGTAWLGGVGGSRGDVKVEFPNNFYLGKYEVTQAEWEAVAGKNPSHFTRTGNGRDEVKGVRATDLSRHPVESVSWDDCRAFVAQLNEKTAEPGFVYRLPTDAEWEYACRGGPCDRADSGFDYYLAKSVQAVAAAQANIDATRTLKRTARVGSYPPNALGLHDMHGNVWEWCDDDGRIDDGTAHKIHRGGGWYNDAVHCRAVSRDRSPAALRLNGIGLRLARVPTTGGATPADADR